MESEPKTSRWPEKGLKVTLALVVGLVLLGWLLNTPPGLLGKADAIGYAVCHRIDLRSFHLGERALPLCARCSGMYLGAMLGLAYQAIRWPRRSGMPVRSVQAVLVVFVLAFALDGINSFMSLFPAGPLLYKIAELAAVGYRQRDGPGDCPGAVPGFQPDGLASARSPAGNGAPGQYARFAGVEWIGHPGAAEREPSASLPISVDQRSRRTDTADPGLYDDLADGPAAG